MEVRIADLSVSAASTQAGGNPVVKHELAVNAVKQARILDSEAAYILASTLQQFERTIFVNLSA